MKPDGEIVWEYVNRGGTTRPSPIPYDFTPQLRALAKPEELAVTPPNNLEWQLKPDKYREGNFWCKSRVYKPEITNQNT